jgi:ferredoxin/nucleotide-binding universal stress UspA family protein
MPKLQVEGREVEVAPGTSILEAARQVGITIPTLCFLEGCTPATSCMVCVVKVKDPDRLVPSCAARAEDGMVVESETDEVRDARRTALELLLSDHPGDCIAPCQSVCPARMDIPLLLRNVAAGDLAGAVATARSRLVLPATLGRICPAPCEKGCRRAAHDGALSIRLMHRHVADVDLAAARRELPARRPATGKHVAIVGAGPTGLAAAWQLLQDGHGIAVFDDHDKPGGALQYAMPEDRLPRQVLDAETALVQELGAAFRLAVRVGRDVTIRDLARDFDAVLVACGELSAGAAASLGLEPSTHGIKVDPHTFLTPMAGVFAAGDAVHARRMAVRGVADGLAAAECISRHLAGMAIAPAPRPYTTRMGHLSKEEMAALVAGASPDARAAPAAGEAAGLAPDEARRESARCLHCDCRKADACKLRHWAEACGASPHHHRGTRRPVERFVDHPEIVYEPGKCIACGLCIQVASREHERLGMAFIGRGFSVRVGVPFHESLAAGLAKAGAACVAACPTGALAYK